nr:hypothetical protein [Feifania hominis]
MLEAGVDIPPVEVYFVPGKGFYIQDGHHRFAASQLTGIPVKILVVDQSGPIGLPNWKEALPGRGGKTHGIGSIPNQNRAYPND